MKYRKIIVKTLVAVALIAVVVFSIFDFSRNVQRAITAETYETLSEVSKTYNKVFNDRVKGTISTMNILASHLTDSHITSKTEITSFLQNAVNEGGFTKMAVCREDGLSLSNDGTTTNVSGRDYFHKAMSGMADISEPLTTSNGEESIIVVVPIHKGDKVIGVLLGGYPLTVAGNHLLDTTYYSEGYGYIVAPSGDIILSSDHSDKMVDGKNLLSFFEKVNFMEYSMEQLKSVMDNGESGSFAYRYNGQRRFVSFTPSSINDWYTFSLSSDAPMLKDEKVNKQIVFTLVAKLATMAILVLLWIVIGNYRRNKKLLQQKEELRRSEKRFSVAINASSGTLFEVDLKHQLYTYFENPQRIFKADTNTLINETSKFANLSHDAFVDAVTEYFFCPEDNAMVKREMEKLLQVKTTSYEARVRRYDNSCLWCRVDLSISVDNNEEPSFLVGFISDIDSIKTQAIQSELQAQKDPMTGLYNKVAMAVIANKELSEFPYGRHALMVLDIDDFKGINDTLGHAFGDLVIIDVSSKLRTALRSNDIIGRIGGDEFCVLMKNIPNTASVLKKGTELSELFRQTYVGEKQKCKISCSIGIIITEPNLANETFEALYRKADAALYQAKQSGKNRFVLYKAEDAESYPIESGKTNDEDLLSLKKAHTLETYIFELLYTSRDFESSINMALAAIGQQYDISRVSVFENNEDGLTTRNIYEWCNDNITSEIENMQHLKLSSNGTSILECFDENGILNCCDVKELPSYLRDVLTKQNVLATLQVTIFNDEHTFGFIGFDDCNQYRVWTVEEIDKLSYLSKVLSVFLFKNKVEGELLENLNLHLELLNALPNYICVVNPETHTIEYANKQFQKILPGVKAGDFCFQALKGGQNSPCETCLVEKIKQGDIENLEIISTDRKIKFKVDPLEITWTGGRKMVLLYGREESK
ncbi:MAG: diguanylate cyclase [Clostridia bacterium]